MPGAGGGMPGMPGGAGMPGMPGMGGGNPNSPSSPEYPVIQLGKLVAEGKFDQLKDLIDKKATGTLAKLRDNTLDDEGKEKIKTKLTAITLKTQSDASKKKAKPAKQSASSRTVVMINEDNTTFKFKVGKRGEKWKITSCGEL